jgi:heptosyltransferase-2
MKILCVRGGGLGDFIVTLPMVARLRREWPDARIEWLGHPRIAELGWRRFYFDGLRSVNHGPLSAFFTPKAVLDPDWMDYVGSFDLVLSYFYDPDSLFLTNLERCQPGKIHTLSPQLPPAWAEPAAHYFYRILEPLKLDDDVPSPSRVYPTNEDRQAAAAFLAGLAEDTRLVALHPGSGSDTKNWPVEFWEELGRKLPAEDPRIRLLLVEGEADGPRVERLMEGWKGMPLLRARWLPLPILAVLLQRTELFLGHDSGVTHLAAAADADLPIVALFGPTDPAVWAPSRPGVRVLRAPYGLASLKVDEVLAATGDVLRGDRKRAA